jgi:hypothetical protein
VSIRWRESFNPRTRQTCCRLHVPLHAPQVPRATPSSLASNPTAAKRPPCFASANGEGHTLHFLRFLGNSPVILFYCRWGWYAHAPLTFHAPKVNKLALRRHLLKLCGNCLLKLCGNCNCVVNRAFDINDVPARRENNAREKCCGRAHSSTSVEALAVAATVPKLNDLKPNQGNFSVT